MSLNLVETAVAAISGAAPLRSAATLESPSSNYIEPKSPTYPSKSTPVPDTQSNINRSNGLGSLNGLNGVNGPNSLNHGLNGPNTDPRNPVNGTKEKVPEQEAMVPKFSWTEPHPRFVIVLVGADEKPFGLQKDFLCARSKFFRDLLNVRGDQLEYVVRLKDVSALIFGLAQTFLYTGTVIPEDGIVPGYEALIEVWKLGHRLCIDGLCDSSLEAMAECRRITAHIPATPLLVRAWKETPDGSSIRRLLLSWAAEYMRASDSRAEFARSLPQEVLSELVVSLSSLEAAPAPPPSEPNMALSASRKSVHYLEEEDEGGEGLRSAKKQRRVSGFAEPLTPRLSSGKSTPTGSARRPPGRPPGSGNKPGPKPRRSLTNMALVEYAPAQKLAFCHDLLIRMLSGPGFWTRLVGPFKMPVDPVRDNVPDYLEKIKNPMDLSTIKRKMDKGEYVTAEQFVADMQLMFDNCYTYWQEKDPMWAACQKFQRSFEEKYAGMHKWLKTNGHEPDT